MPGNHVRDARNVGYTDGKNCSFAHSAGFSYSVFPNDSFANFYFTVHRSKGILRATPMVVGAPMSHHPQWPARLVLRHRNFATSGQQLAATSNHRHCLRSTRSVAILGCRVTSPAGVSARRGSRPIAQPLLGRAQLDGRQCPGNRNRRRSAAPQSGKAYASTKRCGLRCLAIERSRQRCRSSQDHKTLNTEGCASPSNSFGPPYTRKSLINVARYASPNSPTDSAEKPPKENP